MSKFRKKPVVIEAIQYDGTNASEVLTFCTRPEGNALIQDMKMGIVIKTMEGEMLGGIGDWIIRGVKGEFYPCKPDIFAATYEPA